jgi:hypothetical protein
VVVVGTLTAHLVVALGSYTNQPVTVRLEDGDSIPIAVQSVGALAPAGASGKSWTFKTKADGVRQVKLKDLGGGLFKVGVKAKAWFTAAAANQPADGTVLTLFFGDACFTHVATKKID